MVTEQMRQIVQKAESIQLLRSTSSRVSDLLQQIFNELGILLLLILDKTYLPQVFIADGKKKKEVSVKKG